MSSTGFWLKGLECNEPVNPVDSVSDRCGMSMIHFGLRPHESHRLRGAETIAKCKMQNANCEFVVITFKIIIFWIESHLNLKVESENNCIIFKSKVHFK